MDNLAIGISTENDGRFGQTINQINDSWGYPEKGVICPHFFFAILVAENFGQPHDETGETVGRENMMKRYPL